MDEVPDDMFAAMGSNANCIFVIPSLNLVVARQGMDPDEDEANFNNEMCRKLLEASPFLLDKKSESLKKRGRGDLNTTEGSPVRERHKKDFTGILTR